MTDLRELAEAATQGEGCGEYKAVTSEEAGDGWPIARFGYDINSGKNWVILAGVPASLVKSRSSQADARYFAACSPQEIIKLLDERDKYKVALQDIATLKVKINNQEVEPGQWMRDIAQEAIGPDITVDANMVYAEK